MHHSYICVFMCMQAMKQTLNQAQAHQQRAQALLSIDEVEVGNIAM